MNEQTLHVQVVATLNRLLAKHPDLGRRLQEAQGFAVFPSLGRASAVLGVGYGQGEVCERGQPIGFATLSQITLGVQIGGQTFSELLIFESPEALGNFQRGPVTFTANASAAIVKAAASGTTNFKGVDAMAFSEGGELLELSLGGQKFSFQPPSWGEKGAFGTASEEKEERPGLVGMLASRFSRHRDGKEKEREQEDVRVSAEPATEHEEEEQEGSARTASSAYGSVGPRTIRKWGSKALVAGARARAATAVGPRTIRKWGSKAVAAGTRARATRDDSSRPRGVVRRYRRRLRSYGRRLRRWFTMKLITSSPRWLHPR
jgi:hypothetical protein